MQLISLASLNRVSPVALFPRSRFVTVAKLLLIAAATASFESPFDSLQALIFSPFVITSFIYTFIYVHATQKTALPSTRRQFTCCGVSTYKCIIGTYGGVYHG